MSLYKTLTLFHDAFHVYILHAVGSHDYTRREVHVQALHDTTVAAMGEAKSTSLPWGRRSMPR